MKHIQTFSSFINENLDKSYWLILNSPDEWCINQFGHDSSKLTKGEQKEFDNFLELAKKNYKE